MRLGGYFMAAAAATMAVSPAVAAPAKAGATLLTAKSARAGSPSVNDSDLRGGGVFVAILAALAVIVGIILVANENDRPNSP